MARQEIAWRLWIGLALILACQVALVQWTAPLRPVIEEMPQPLSPLALKALAFGDDEFEYRALAHWLQEIGDGGGRVRPLRDYDYDRVVGWLRLLDGLNGDAEHGHFLAANYFGALIDPTGGPPRVRKIVGYLRDIALADPAKHWEWLVWCATTARVTIKDRELAVTLANDFATMHDPAVPAWTKLVAVHLYKFARNEAAAQEVMEHLTQAERDSIQSDRDALAGKLKEQGFQ